MKVPINNGNKKCQIEKSGTTFLCLDTSAKGLDSERISDFLGVDVWSKDSVRLELDWDGRKVLLSYVDNGVPVTHIEVPSYNWDMAVFSDSWLYHMHR